MPTKYKHKDGTETILKVKHYEFNKETLKREEVKRNFVTLFLSVSNGCNIGCKLCSLTYLQKQSYLLQPEQIIKNNKDLVNSFPYNKIKVSYMGMGEGVLLYKHLQNIAEEICGDRLYSVEVGTMMPFISEDLSKYLNSLKSGRLFYSLHSANQNTRDKIINSKVSLKESEEFLNSLKIQKVCHYTPINDLNDSNKEINEAIDFCNRINAQLRILEFNKPNKSNFEPTKRRNEIFEILRSGCKDYKICYSSGKSIKAACGMFF